MTKPILLVSSRFTKAIEERLDRDPRAPRMAVAIVIGAAENFDRRL